jgi:hypothetical protein
VDESEPANRGGLRQDGAKFKFKYIWKTDPRWTGTCRKLVLTLVDGSSYEALFRFSGKPYGTGDREREQDRVKGKSHEKENSRDKGK